MSFKLFSFSGIIPVGQNVFYFERKLYDSVSKEKNNSHLEKIIFLCVSVMIHAKKKSYILKLTNAKQLYSGK